MMSGSAGSIAKVVTGSWTLTGVQCASRSTLLNAQLDVPAAEDVATPAYTVAGIAGSTAKASMDTSVRPLLTGVQRIPAVTLLGRAVRLERSSRASTTIGAHPGPVSSRATKNATVPVSSATGVPAGRRCASCQRRNRSGVVGTSPLSEHPSAPILDHNTRLAAINGSAAIGGLGNL